MQIQANKSQMALVVIIIMILLSFLSFICCCSLSLITGGFGDWYMSECLDTAGASELEKAVCYSKETDDVCRMTPNCWWRDSIITMLIDSITGDE